jgi:hypothetical protein
MTAALQHQVIEDVRPVDLPELSRVMAVARAEAPRPMPPPGHGQRTHRKPPEKSPEPSTPRRPPMSATLTESDRAVIDRQMEHACRNFRTVAGQALHVTPEQADEISELVTSHYAAAAAHGIDRATTDAASQTPPFAAVAIGSVLARDAQRVAAARALAAPAAAPAAWSPRAASVLAEVLAGVRRVATTESGSSAADFEIIRTELTALIGARPQETS